MGEAVADSPPWNDFKAETNSGPWSEFKSGPWNDFQQKELTAEDLPAEAEALKAAEHTADLAIAAKPTPIENNAESIANALGWTEFMVHGMAHPIQQAETAVEQTAIAAGLAKPGSKLLVSPSKVLETPALGEIPHLPQAEYSNLNPISSRGRQVGRGVINAAIDLVNFIQTPEGAAMAGTGQLEPAAQKAVLRTFAVQMAAQAPDQLMQAVELGKQGDIQGAVQQATAGIGGTLLARTMAEHANNVRAVSAPGEISFDENKIAEAGAPATAEALKETAPKGEAKAAEPAPVPPAEPTVSPAPVTQETMDRLAAEAKAPEAAAPAVPEVPPKATEVPPSTETPKPVEVIRKSQQERTDALYKAEHSDLMDLQRQLEDAQKYDPEKVDELRFERDDAVSRLEQFDKLHKRSGEISWDDSPEMATVKALRQNPEAGMDAAVIEGAKQRRSDIENRIYDEEPVPPAAYKEYPDLKPKTEPSAAEPAPKLTPKPAVEPGQGGAPYFRKLGAQDALDPARKRMRSVPQNFKLAYLDGWYESKKSKTTPAPVAQAQAEVTPTRSVEEIQKLINRTRAAVKISDPLKKKGKEARARLAALEAELQAAQQQAAPTGPVYWSRTSPETDIRRVKPQSGADAGERVRLADGQVWEYKGVSGYKADNVGRINGWEKVERPPESKETTAVPPKEPPASPSVGPGAEAPNPTVISNEPPSPSALGVSPISLATAMTGKVSDMAPAIRGVLKTSAGETMPKTTMLDREAGEAGAHYGQSPFYAHYAARALSESVLPHDSKIEPAKLGAALTEDALRGRRQEFLKKAAAATTAEEAAKFTEMANNVGTLVGKFGMFRDEAALQAFIKDPEVLAAVDRLKQLYASELDPLAKNAGLDITTKPEGGGLFPGAFINLFVPKEGGLPSRTSVKTRPVQTPTPGAPGPSAGTPRLTATMKKRSRFGLQRTGASELYGVDFHDMVANAFGGFTEIARKNEFDQALVKAGLAKIQQEYPGPGWTHFPYEKRQILGLDEGDVAWRKTVNKGVWVKNSVAGEYSTVSNLYRNEFGNTAVRFVANAVNKFQMLGILDATFHSTALLRRLWEAPIGKGDTALSLLRPLTLPKRLSMLAANIFQERLAKNDKLAELANIGALTGHGQVKPHQIVRRIVNFLEENVRLTLSDMYDQLIKEGAPNTETSRREYINAGLQYNRRFQGPAVRFLRNTGLGPFVTAGRAGLARGVRRWFLQDWIPGQDAPGQAWIAANILTKMAGTALTVGVINRMLTGHWMGRPGTPLGNVDTGKDDEKTGRPLSVPLANLMGSEMRGARVLGLKAVAEGLRDDSKLPQIIDAAAKDSFNAITHPGIGPALQAAYGAAYGKPTAIGAPEYPKVAPGSGQSQFGSNVKQAAEELNPMVMRGGRNLVSWATGGKIAPAEEAPLERVKSVAIQTGQKPMTSEEKQNMIDFSQLKKYTDQLATEARKLKIDKRADFILEQFEKDKLGEEFKKKAIEQLKRHGVFTHE